MKASKLAILFSVLFALFPIIVPAADFPVLPADKNITKGILENGLSYYIVNNKTEAGRLDVALVQKTEFSSEDSLTGGHSVIHTIGALATLPRFRTPSPLKYLISKAVWPGPEGYVSIGSDATVFHFRNIPVTEGMEAVDSTLLLAFEIVNAAPGASSGRYPLGSQAIVISGDITPAVALGKLNMLSMLINRRDSSAPREEYVWKDSQEAVIRRSPAPAPLLGSFSLTWRSPRTPAAQMNSILPLASGMYFRELAALAQKRLAKAFYTADIAVTSLNTQYIGSDETSGDELFSVGATVAMRDYKAAARLIVDTMADIDKNGISASEFLDISKQVLTDVALDASKEVKTNVILTGKCVSSFLYGTSLATEESKAAYLTGRTMNPEVSVKIFNDFAGVLMDGSRNLVVDSRADTTLLSVSEIKSYLAGWDRVAATSEVPVTSQSDTLSLAWASARKIKLKEDAAELMAGGRMYTFSNGMRVVFKKTDSKGVFRFSWNMKGGWSSIPELSSGEGAYIGDMLMLENIGSMSGRRFSNMLKANGISLRTKVTAYDMTIRGAAPSDKLYLLMKSLASLTYKRSPDADAFRRYCHSLAVRQMLDARSEGRFTSAMDSLLCPKNRYITEQLNIGLPKNLPVKAETYFSRQFSNMSNGVLIITGDLEEAAVRKALLSWLGAFSSGSGSAAHFRSNAVYSTSLRSKVLPAAAQPRLDLGFTADADFTPADFIVCGVASDAMLRSVSEAVVPLGWYASYKWDLRMFPDEKVFVRLHLEKQDYRGRPATVIQEDSVQVVLRAAKKALSRLAADGISEDVFNRVKANVVSDMNSWSASPDYLMRLYELRYNYGRDFMTGLNDRATRITKENVDAMLRAIIVKGGSGEIIVPGIIVEDRQLSEELPEPIIPYNFAQPVQNPDSTGLLRLFKEVFAIEED